MEQKKINEAFGWMKKNNRESSAAEKPGITPQ